MMTLIQIFILSVVQGITELLPISSSAHLIVLPKLALWAEQSLGSSVALHFGTLLAIIVYFWRDFLELCIGGMEILAFRKNHRTQYTIKVILATAPILIVGLYFKDMLKQEVLFPNIILIIAFTSIIFGILLWLIDKIVPEDEYIQDLSYGGAFLIGCFQVLALVPGVSRSGICMTAARVLRLKRTESAKISVIMGMPTLLGAVCLMGIDWYQVAQDTQQDFFDWSAIYGICISFIVACLVIHFMMAWFRRFSMGIFAVYRIVFGIVLLVLFV